MSGDILSRIDAEVDAWERGDDAACWRADVALAPETRPIPASRIEWQRPRLSRGMFGRAAEFERHMAALSQAERDEFVAYWQAGPWSFEQAWFDWHMRHAMEPVRVALSVWTEQLTAALRSAQEAAALLTRAFGLKPCELFTGPCFCHPAPFPAARDYRRRTKHRNRRRR